MGRRLSPRCCAVVIFCVGCAPTAPPEPPEPHEGRLVVNEVNCGKNPDEFIELVNVGDGVVDTAGYGVSDDDDDDDPFPVPPRQLEPGERVMVTGDLGLSCARDGAFLSRVVGAGRVVVDRAPVRRGDPDRSTWGRFPDGTGPFQETTPTPQKENRAFLDERAAVFDDDVAVISVVDLFVDAAAEDALSASGKAAGYVPAIFAMTDEHGPSVPQHVSIRIKGSISLRPWEGKPGLKVHFANHGEPGPTEFRGLRKMTLNNLTYDPSFVREYLAYEVMRAAGHPAPRVSWVQLFVNGEDKGLYASVETYDRVFLADHYDSTAVLYESDGLTAVGSLGGFDVDEGEEDFGALQALAAHVESLPTADNAVQALPEVDWLQVARVSALEDLLAHFDGHKGACHNFFLHQDEPGRWTLLPWSVDLTLVTAAFSTDAPLPSCGPLAQLCDSDPQCRAWFERDRDRAAQLVLRPPFGGSWRDVVVPIAERLQPFAQASDEPFSGNEFWSGVGTDLMQNTNDVVDLLERRARHIRCASARARGQEPVDIDDDETADCHGFFDVGAREDP